MVDIKALVPAILIAITFIFSIAACGAQQAEGPGNTKIYLVKYTAAGTDFKNEDLTCKERRETMNATAAFGIMACIIAGVATIIAILAAIGKFPGPKIVNVILLVVVAVFSLISWAVMIHGFEDKLCGYSLKNDGKMDLAGGFACMIITTGLALISLVLSLVLGGGDAANAVQPA